MGPSDRMINNPRHETMLKGAASLGQPRFAVLDIETSGLSPTSDRVVEMAVVTTDPRGRVLSEWSTRVNPEGSVGASHIHGISQDDVASAPVFRDLVAALIQQLAGAALVAHNAPFDLAFLAAEFHRAGWQMPKIPTLCTLAASEHHLPSLPRRRLADCCWAVGTPLTGAHSALGDARGTAVLLAAFMHPNVGMPPLPEHVALPERALAVRWPLASDTNFIDIASPRDEAEVATPTVYEVPRPAPALVEALSRMSLRDALGDGAPSNSLAYMETLALALEDGQLYEDERVAIGDAATAMGLSAVDAAAANLAFVHALAHTALNDGRVSRDERAELNAVADVLGLSTKVLLAVIGRAEVTREMRLSAGLAPLPVGWTLGEPLRVGSKVVFTGCVAHNRPDLEERSEAAGVRVLGTMSPQVALLISDGTMEGGKTSRARELGTRIVHPDDYRSMLDHVQPALPRTARELPEPKGPTTSKPVAFDPVELPAGISSASLRAWGRANGWDVGSRGRLHPDLVAAFVAANS